jgi:hypothetical protein
MKSKSIAYLHAANTQREADTQIVTIRPFDGKNGIRDEKEDTKRENGDTDPTGDIDLFRSI